VPEEIGGRLGDTGGRQRALAANGHLLLVLHELPGDDDKVRIARFFWRETDGNWRSNNLGPGIQSLRKHVSEHLDRLEALDEQLHVAQTADDYFQVLQVITPLSRASRNLHATLQQARELSPQDHELISVRDLAGTAERMAELLHADAKNGLDFTVARAAEDESRRTYQMAVSAHRLNLLAAIFFPLATISSLLSMKLNHGLDEASTAVFWATVIVGAVAGVALALVIARRPLVSFDRPRPQRKHRRR